MTHHILILGGSYAGVQIAHRLAKNTRKQIQDLKVTLVSKNSHFYWNLASVRAIVPGVLEEDKYNLPLDKGFAQYPAENFELIVGSAEQADPDAKTVRISTASGERVLEYDHLVLATGSRTRDKIVPWKGNGTNEENMALLRHIQDKVAAAEHIIVAGAGPTGVETAAELAFAFKGKKEITLLSADATLLSGDSIATAAETELRKLGVKIEPNSRVTGTDTTEDGKTLVSLKNGEAIVTDLYLPTMGVVANTEYLPEKMLKPNKFLDIDDFYRVKGYHTVWAAGDIVWSPRGSYVQTDKQAAGVAKNIDLVLNGKPPTPVKLIPIDILMCSTGRSRGVGRIGPVKAFSLIVYMIKGKTLGTQDLPALVNGTKY